MEDSTFNKLIAVFKLLFYLGVCLTGFIMMQKHDTTVICFGTLFVFLACKWILE